MQQPLIGKTCQPSFGGEWKTTRFADIASIRNQKTLASKVAIGTLCIELNDISKGSGKLLRYSTDQGSNSPKYCFFSGDILFGRLRSYLRKFWYADRDGICTTEIWPLRINPQKTVGGFLYAIIQSDRFIEAASISYGTHMPRADWGILKNFEISLPQINEQCAIAETLSDVDGLLGALEALIAKKQAIKQSAMQQLLTGKIRLPGFVEKWEVRRLAEIGSFLKGKGINKNEVDSGDLPCVRYGEIYTQHDDYIRTFTSWISENVAGTATKLKQGDLLFAGSGETREEIGKCVAFVDDCEAYAGGDIVILRPIGVCSKFMGYYCNTVAVNTQKMSKGQGNQVVHIGASALSNIIVTLPPLSEQTAIAMVLSDMDAEITALELRREKIQSIKQGMMQQLLTGKIRLVKTDMKS